MGIGEVAKQVRISRQAVNNIRKREMMEKAEGGGRKKLDGKMDMGEVKRVVESKPTKSLRNHAKDLGVGRTAFREAVKVLGGKSLVRVERPLMTPQIKETHLLRCQGLLNNLKSGATRRVINFSDEKTWTVDPTRNRRNDRYVAFEGEIDESIHTLTTTKHPAGRHESWFCGIGRQEAPVDLVSSGRLPAQHSGLHQNHQ